MNLGHWPKSTYLSLLLIALLFFTRYDHFGSPVNLPDATQASFFLAGLWILNQRLLAFLLLEAALIDYLAITHLGASSYCVSPAYYFLIPSYTVLWLAGHFIQKPNTLISSYPSMQLVVLVSATILAFTISNSSYYLLSDHFTAISWEEYSSRVTQYLPPYVVSTLCYSLFLIAIGKIVAFLSTRQRTQKVPA